MRSDISGISGGAHQLAGRVRSLVHDSAVLGQKTMEHQAGVIVRMAEIIHDSLRTGGKLLLCGNGGSAAEAAHLAAELLVRLRPHVNRDGLPALALGAEMASLTACGNDYSFEAYYERMVLTLGRPGDVLLGLSTSGKSANVIRALSSARSRNIVSLGFLGGEGGLALPECDLALVVPSFDTGRIQEVHLAAGHALMELVEDLSISSGLVQRT